MRRKKWKVEDFRNGDLVEVQVLAHGRILQRRTHQIYLNEDNQLIYYSAGIQKLDDVSRTNHVELLTRKDENKSNA